MFRLATPPDISERALVEQCLDRDAPSLQRLAQRTLFERYKRAMFSTVFRLLNDYDAANDALQDGFVEVFRNLGGFRHESTLGAWIKTIMVRQALRQRRLFPVFQPLDTLTHDPPADLPDTLTGEQLDVAIRSLPDGCRAVFLLAEVEGYPHREVAQMLNISEGTSKSQVNYARKLLRQKLGKGNDL
ncbi:MAG: RNA polymerase sigma factor [Cytophagales bacterium]|nr:MAG: RNA polymerase sigma factor [Cytophagales bacterium]